MKIITRLLALILPVLIIAPARAESIYAQLCRVNPEWKKITPDAALLRDTVFTDENALLRTHMFMVEKRLRNIQIEQSATLNKERIFLLDALHEYGVASLFPKNTRHPNERRAYFIDDYGTHCAVGNLIRATGNDALARRIAGEYNYELLRDIHTEGLSDWQKTSGLAMNELALIQVLYVYEPGQPRPQPENPLVSPGIPIDHPINVIVENDTTLVQPVAGEAYFSNGQTWYKGEGGTGILNGVWTQYYSNGQPHVIGNFTMGEKEGAWTEYGRNGEIVMQTVYSRPVPENQLRGVSGK